MNDLNIKYLFASADDILARLGATTCRLLKRLARKYAALQKWCSREQMLLAVSLAWGLTAEAENGNVGAFLHIDEAMHLRQVIDCQMVPAPHFGGTVMVKGIPFYFEEKDHVMERFFWDSFALMIEHSERAAEIGQYFYDVAETHQWKAYEVDGEADGMSIADRSETASDGSEMAPHRSIVATLSEVDALLSRLASLPNVTIQVNNFFEGDFHNYGTLTGNCTLTK